MRVFVTGASGHIGLPVVHDLLSAGHHVFGQARSEASAAEIAAAMTMEAVGSLDDSFDERVALAKPHPGQIATSARLRALTRPWSRSIVDGGLLSTPPPG